MPVVGYCQNCKSSQETIYECKKCRKGYCAKCAPPTCVNCGGRVDRRG